MMVEGKKGNGKTDKALPDGWRWVKLGEICDTKLIGFNPKESPNQEFTYIDISSIDNITKTISEPKKILGQDAPSRAKRIVKTGDVIVSTTRPNLNAVAIVPRTLDKQVCSTGFCILRPTEKIDSVFLFHFVRSSRFVFNLSKLVQGALYPAVTDKQVYDQEIPLPPIEEQRRMVAILSERLAAVDQARRATQAQLEAAQALPAAYLRQIFDTVDTQFPNDKFCLKQVCEAIVDCEHKTAPTQEVGIPMVRTSNIRSGVIDFDNSRRVSEETYKQWTARLEPKANDLILAREAPVGEVGIIPVGQRACLGQRTVLIRVDHQKVFAKYIMYFLMDSNSKREMIRLSGGSLVPHLNMSDIRDFQIILPPLKIQKDIVEKLDAKTQDTTRLLQSLQSQLDTINALPAALLRQAFSGEL